MEMTRWNFLLSVTVMGIFSWLGSALCFPRLQVFREQTRTIADMKGYLLELFTDQDAPYLLGKRYLDLYPHHQAHAFLLAERIQAVQPRTAMALKKMLSRQRESDFHYGQTITIDGWLLARTEAEVCALTVLL